MIVAVVPAAGTGSRLGGEVPKQYLTLGQGTRRRTVIEHALSVLLDYPELEHVAVAVAPDDAHWTRLPVARHPVVTTATGGDSRAASVLAGLGALRDQLEDDDWVLVHDAARPCLRAEDLDALGRGAKRSPDGALLAVPARDTLKQADGRRVTATLDRSTVWQAQTPQMFRVAALQAALDAADASVTDEASAIEAQGGRPTLVPGHHDNLKITFLEDLALAEAALRTQGRL